MSLFPNALETEGGTPRDTIVEVMKRRFEFETGVIRQNVSACALLIERRYYQNSAGTPHVRTVSICRGDLLSIESYFQAN